jgi:ribosome-binding factor A
MSRVDKVAEEIRREASKIVQDELRDPRLGFTTVTRVELTPDLRFARIFFSVYGHEKQWEDTLDALESASGFIRRELGHRLQLRFVPEIVFKSDHSAEHSIRIEQELEAIHLQVAVEKKAVKKERVRRGTKKTVRRTAKKKK